MLLEDFKAHLKNNFPFLSPANCKLIIAVSGGVDSVVATDLLFHAGFQFSIAHCNFLLRNEESNRDEAFVQSLAATYQKKFFVKQFNTQQYAATQSISIQEAARELRYHWFSELLENELKQENFPCFLITAHQQDDALETMLFHFFRGSGIKGLTGIPSFDKKRKIIRPLLFASRDSIMAYANENNLSWVEDSSNQSDKYTRNFFRHQIIPSVARVFPDVKQTLFHNMMRLQHVNELYFQAIALHKKNLCEQKGNEVHIPVLKLQQSSPLETIVWEIIKEYHFTPSQTAAVIKLFNAVNASYVESSTHRIIKNRHWLIIAPKVAAEAFHIIIEEGEKNIAFEAGKISLKKISNTEINIITPKNIALLNAGKIQYPLLLRKWKAGDYFYPLGMKKKKKLARFFIDEKLSLTEKENIYVIESNKKILWIINHRIDERFKITAHTQEILQLIFTQK